MKTNSLPLKISIASPCPARWEDMGGDEKVRFCDHCRKNVYNISAMSAADATSLLQEKNGNLCARIYQRTDGTVLTEDCPVGIAQYWRRIRRLAASATALFVFVVANLATFARGDERPGTNRPSVRLPASSTVTNNANPPRPLLMGRVCVKPGTNSTSSPRPFMGKVAIPASQPKGTVSQTNTPIPMTGTPIWLMGDVAQTTMRDAARQANSTNAPVKK